MNGSAGSLLMRRICSLPPLRAENFRLSPDRQRRGRIRGISDRPARIWKFRRACMIHRTRY